MIAARRTRRDYRSQRGAQSRSVKGTTVAGEHLLRSNDEAAQKFAVVVVNFPAKTLANAADVSLEAAKLWKAGRRCPSWPHIARMGQTIPAIRAHIKAESEPGLHSERLYHDTVTMLTALANLPGPEGTAARRALIQMQGRG